MADAESKKAKKDKKKKGGNDKGKNKDKKTDDAADAEKEKDAGDAAAALAVAQEPGAAARAAKFRVGWIFLSYEETCKWIAEETFTALQAKGWRCWMQSRANKKDEEGRPLEENLVIGRGIDGASMFISFLTEEYGEDFTCQTEMTMAYLNNLPIVHALADRNYKPNAGWLLKYTKGCSLIDYAAGTVSGVCGVCAAIEQKGLFQSGALLGPRPKPIPIPEEKKKKKKKKKKDQENEEAKAKEQPWTPWFDPVLEPYDDLEREQPVTADNIVLGARVRRGPDWGGRNKRWAGWKADGGPLEASGIIVASTTSQRGETTGAAENDRRATVRWFNTGLTFTYSIGAFEPQRYDLLMESGLSESDLYSEDLEDEDRDPLALEDQQEVPVV